MEPTLFSLDTSDHLVYALGWTVLHSLWQGTLLALLVGVSAAFIKKQSARTRYWTALVGLGGLLFWAIFTFVRIYQIPFSEVVWTSNVVFEETNNGLVISTASEGTGPWLPFLSYFEAHLPMIVTCWLVGMSVFALRFLGGLAYIQQLKYQYNRPVDTKFELLLNQLSAKVKLKQKVSLVESTKIRVPMTIGHLKPIVLLPAGALLALSPAQVEAVLAHELAHIKRNDFLVNLFQSIVEVLFYYHPAVWWLSAQVRLERENCCDDIAVAACGDDLEYAKALLSLQEYAKSSPTFAMAFSNKKNHLLNRVKRILNHPINSNRIMEKFSITALILLCLLVVSMRDGHDVYDPLPENSESVVHIDVADDNSLVEFISVQADTLPKGKVNLKLTRNGEKIEAKVENGQIKSLKINGEVQDKSMYDAYLPVLEEVMNIPPPPAPPAPFAPPAPGAPAASPAPAAPGSLNLPPPPPAPGAVAPPPPAPAVAPAPSVIQIQKSVKVKSGKGDDGNTIVIVESEGSGEPVEIEFSDLKDGEKVILLNGERMEEGESTIFVDEVVVEEYPTHRIHFHDLETMLDFEGQYGAKIAILDSVRSNLASVVVVRSDAREELLKLEKELAKAQQSSNQEDRQRLIELEMKLAETKKALDENIFILRQQTEERLEGQRMAMDMQIKEMEKLREVQAVKVGELRELAEQQKANQEKMISEMVKDGLLESADNYNISISNTMLKVNGKKQPQAVFEKYKKIYENSIESRTGKYK
ncbi:MAG: M56 family metallopeptidase, partial [Bacteroidota bacterium]